MTELKIGLTPCPNDLFIFYGLLENKINSKLSLSYYIDDIETLNKLTLECALCATKHSFGIYNRISHLYEINSTGAAFGMFSGPKVISKNFNSIFDNCSVAFPGEHTSAYVLFDHFSKTKYKPVFSKYDNIINLVQSEKVDFGVVIHESINKMYTQGFNIIQDLGMSWNNLYKIPVPLGCLSIKKSIPEETKIEFKKAIKESLLFSINNFDKVFDFIKKNNKIKNDSIIKFHLQSYINSETLEISENGWKAINKLLNTKF